MSESLGLSIGVANLVAARAGGAPVTRSSVLTLFDDRPTEVGLPEENPNLTQPGMVMRGFVERVGDRAPLVAADGTKYLPDALAVEALEAMARAAGYGSPIAIAVPAYWSEAQRGALRSEFFAQPGLTADGVTPLLVSDATAALAALQSNPGFPGQGFIALCDFGAGGTTVTLADAAANLQPVGRSVRYPAFSGEAVDQLVADYVQSGGQDAATSLDVGTTTRTPSASQLLGECQRAKEQLSTGTVTTIATGSEADFRLSRTEFEQLISGPLDQFLAALDDILLRGGVPRANLAAVATVGGGAAIPLVTTRLSERLQVPILTTPEPALSAAIGAAVIGPLQQSSAEAATAAGAAVETPTEMVRASRTEAVPALAWSQDADGGDEPVPYTGPEHAGGYGVSEGVSDGVSDTVSDTVSDGPAPAAPKPPAEPPYAAQPGPLPWYKRTALVLSVAAALAAITLAVVLALTVGGDKTNPAPTSPTEPTPAPSPSVITTTDSNGNTGTSTVPVPPPPPPATATTQPATTTTTTPSPTTTTTTHSAPPTQPSSTAPPSSTASPTRPPRPTFPFPPRN
jgi:hypothetical protein